MSAAAFLLLFPLMPSARAQDSSPLGISLHPARAADRAAAITSIQAQLKAFQRDNYQKAVQYQSSGLKRNFPSVADFRRMMQTQYPAFINFKSASFGAAQTPDNGRHLLIPVSLSEGNGVTVRAFYIMVREGKAYKVDGVEGGTAPPPDADPGDSLEA